MTSIGSPIAVPIPRPAVVRAASDERIGRIARFWRGRPQDPAWVRPALLFLLVVAGFLYLWDLSESGWANAFYSAAVEAGTKSWKAFFFGSFDSSNFITVDKPPLFLWVMDISARLFGLNSWSILVPNAVEGVGTVGVVYLAVRRWFGPAAGLIGGVIVAATPVAALMFRYNNPDALLAFLLALALYATMRGIEDGRTRWIVLAGGIVGLAFLTKMLQAFMVLPAIGIVYLVAAPGRLGRRISQLFFGTLALVVAGGWWVAVVQAIPAKDRPYIGSSQHNSLLTLIFGYNGFGRLTGNESGSVGGGTGTTNRWGITGLVRLFSIDMGSQISWLLPAALVLLVVGLVVVGRGVGRWDRQRAGLLLWGGTLLVTGVVLSFGQGIIHPYYTVALAAPIGAVVGMGVVLLWQRRASLWVRCALAVAVAASAYWSYVLWGRSPGWYSGIRVAALIAGLLGAAAIVVMNRLHPWARAGVLGVAAAGVLSGSLAFTADTVTTGYTGALPLAGPTQVGANAFGSGVGGGPGGFPGGGGGKGRGFPTAGRSGFPTAGRSGFPTAGRSGFPTAGRSRGAPSGFPGFGGGTGSKGRPGAGGGGFPVGGSGATPESGSGERSGTFPGFRGASGAPFGGGRGSGRRGSGGAGGSLLTASHPDEALVRYVEKDAKRYTWIVATVGSNSAAGYELSTDDPVMAIGGFNGTDPAPTMAQFKEDVEAHKIHYFITGGAGGFGGGPGGSGGFGGGPGGSGGDPSSITSWVEAHYHSTTVDGATVYDLTSRDKS